MAFLSSFTLENFICLLAELFHWKASPERENAASVNIIIIIWKEKKISLQMETREREVAPGNWKNE